MRHLESKHQKDINGDDLPLKFECSECDFKACAGESISIFADEELS